MPSPPAAHTPHCRASTTYPGRLVLIWAKEQRKVQVEGKTKFLRWPYVHYQLVGDGAIQQVNFSMDLAEFPEALGGPTWSCGNLIHLIEKVEDDILPHILAGECTEMLAKRERKYTSLKKKKGVAAGRSRYGGSRRGTSSSSLSGATSSDAMVSDSSEN